VTHERVYQRGAYGFLEPYDFNNYQDGFVGSVHLNAGGVGGSGGGGGSVVTTKEEDVGEEEPNSSSSATTKTHLPHESRDRMGLTNFDHNRGIGVDNYDEDSRRRLLRGSGSLKEDVENIPSLSSSFFKYNEENDPEEMEEYEVIEYDYSDAIIQQLDGSRRLQSHHSKSSSAAHAFANGQSQSTTTTITTAYKKPIDPRKKEQDEDPPVIRSTFPPKDTSIGAHQTFGALVSDNGTGVKKVCLQFKDHERGRSECFKLQNVGVGSGDGGGEAARNVRGGRKKSNTNAEEQQQQTSDIWQLSFEGFAPYAGTSWQYRIKSVDGARNKRSTKWRSFTIDERAAGGVEGGANGSNGNSGGGGGSVPATQAPQRTVQKLTEEVKDKDWANGGIVQTSTGRILFFFDGNPYVCTGTVLQSAPSDRTIILTAGHCAYQYRDGRIGGRFAEHALFIPNQVDTRGDKSNEICDDDPLGCWVPAFAVVDYEWTTQGFPHSVPWDYAYYVIRNDPEVHQGGFIHKGQPNLSKILEEIVEPLPIDFEWNLGNDENNNNDDAPGEFTHGLGYSFNRDPAFRYCATSMTTKFGIDSYENLWLESCEMTGGSSGGPWMTHVDDEGRGTVVSVNSWGYATSPGMGGPNFATESGSHARCLYERARDAVFEDVAGRGIVVDDCP